MQTTFIDSLQQIEIQVRGAGGWYHRRNDNGAEHYYINRNPKSSVAVSLCGSVVTPMVNLGVHNPERKCFVCALFASTREKGGAANEATLTKIADANTSDQDE